MLFSYLKLAIAALLPVLLSVVFYLLGRQKTAFSRIPDTARQLIIGVAFGALACVGTHWGISINGAMVNARDAAVLIAGLMFGPIAGITAGVVGGLERFLATVIWDIGSFTVLACSVSTFLAGVYAALLRKFMFEDKKPGWLISLAIGVIMEVFHLTMVFVTNMAETERAIRVVEACTPPMLIANGLSVMFSSMLISMCAHELLPKNTSANLVKISQKIQRELLVTVVATFAIIFVFLVLFQTNAANNQTDSYLKMAIEEVKSDVNDTSDSNMLRITRQAAEEYENGTLMQRIVKKYGLSDAQYINQDGIIVDSTVTSFIGYDMASADQSAEFLVILEGESEYVQEFRKIGYDDRTMRKYAAVASGEGFFQIGYDLSSFQDIIDDSIVGITKNRHVGETGYVVILDEDYHLVSGPEGFNLAELDAQAEVLQSSKEGVTFTMTLGGETVFARASRAEGYNIISIFPQAEAYYSRTIALYINSFLLILVFALMFAFIYFVIKQAVVNQIKSINNSLSKITQGNLNEVVDVRSSAEFASLSDDINSTVTTLKGYISEAERRIEAELEFANTIQHSALPSVFPAYPSRTDFDVFASMNAAKEVGGDFYDFYLMGDKKLCILIADVSGKGIPAAMFMMRAKSLLKSLTESGKKVTEVFFEANNALCTGNDANMFVTAWEGIIDLETGRMSFTSAGHNPPAVRHRDGSFQFLHFRPGFVLAGMEGARYRENEYVLQPGDQIFLYTDGVTEATNLSEELFGDDRLLEALDRMQNVTAEALCRGVKEAVDDFADEAPQFDDITMLALTYEGPGKAKE